MLVVGVTEYSVLSAAEAVAVITPVAEAPTEFPQVIVPLSEAAIAFITIPLILLIVTAFGK